MKVAALVDDLFFTSKITATAGLTGCQVLFYRSAAEVPDDADRVLVDLNAKSFDAIQQIRTLKARHPAPVLAYFSHVETETKQRAEQAGADEILARSSFVARLPKILVEGTPAPGRSFPAAPPDSV